MVDSPTTVCPIPRARPRIPRKMVTVPFTRHGAMGTWKVGEYIHPKRGSIPRTCNDESRPRYNSSFAAYALLSNPTTWQPGPVTSFRQLTTCYTSRLTRTPCTGTHTTTHQTVVWVVPTLPPPRNLLKQGLVQPPLSHHAAGFATLNIPPCTSFAMIS